MKSLFKNTFKGLSLFGMTLSFILAPIPHVNVVWADSSSSETGCYKEGDSDSERIYRPNCEMGDIVQKSRMSRYSESHGSFIAMMEQAVAGMMAVTLIQSLRFKYLHELQNKTLYGNDCPQNKAGAWTLRIAQLGALSYLTGDILANTKFQKESQKATDVAFGTPTNSEEFKATKNEQLRTFDTLIEVLEGQEKGLKTKQALSIVSQASFLASLGLEGVGIVTCNGICAANLATQETRLATLQSAITLAGIAVATETSTPPYGTCATGAAAIAALEGALASSKAAYLASDQATSKAKLSKRIADSTFWVGVLLRLKSLFLGLPADGVDHAANNIASQQSEQLSTIDTILKRPVQRTDDAIASAELQSLLAKLTTALTKDTTVMSSATGFAQSCVASRVLISAALSSFIEYFYTPINCCGGPGMNKALQDQLTTSKTALRGIADSLSGQATIQGNVQEGISEAIKKAQSELMNEAIKKGVGEAVKSIDPTQMASNILKMSNSGGDSDFATGTIQGLGQAIPSQFASGKDIRVQGLLDGLFSSTESRKAFKYYAKNNFESMLRRIGMKVQNLEMKGKTPKESLKLISGIEQRINNILFFFDQVIEETPANELAQGKFKKGENWQTVMNLISDMVFPKAHALGMLGNMAAGMGLQMVQKAVGTKGPWDEILGLGSQYMLLNGVIGKFAKSHGFTSPKGRMYTYGAMNVVNGAVLAVDQKAKKDVEDYIEVLKDERERYANAIGYGGVSDGEGGEGNGDDTRGKLVANSGDSSGREVINGEANIRRCATANGQGFLPAPCPMKVSGSTFDPPKISKDYASGLTPDHLSTMKNISNISRGLATGSMGADDLATMDLDSWQSANNAMRAFNEKLIKKIDAADKERFKHSDVKPTPLQEMLNDAKKAFSGGASAPALASLNPSKSKLNAKGESTKDKKESAPGFTKTNPYGKGGSTGSTTGKDEFDFGFNQGGVETEKREVAVNPEKSLDDFVINHDDINKRKDVSIFKILSNRYLLSYPKVLEEK